MDRFVDGRWTSSRSILRSVNASRVGGGKKAILQFFTAHSVESGWYETHLWGCRALYDITKSAGASCSLVSAALANTSCNHSVFVCLKKKRVVEKWIWQMVMTRLKQEFSSFALRSKSNWSGSRLHSGAAVEQSTTCFLHWWSQRRGGGGGLRTPPQHGNMQLECVHVRRSRPPLKPLKGDL